MELTCDTPSQITVRGNIKSIDDYLAIRKAVMELVEQGTQALCIRLMDSLSMPSSVIGFFVKLVNRDHVSLSMEIHDPRLHGLLEELNLSEAFGARLVEP